MPAASSTTTTHSTTSSAAVPSIAFIGGGNMASALAAGLTGSAAGQHHKQRHKQHHVKLHVIDIAADTCAAWRARGASAASAPDARLAECRVWVYAVKPQQMREVVAATRGWLRADTLVISIAAGVRADTLARWLGEERGQPWPRIVRAMPNTPALIGAGVTGLAALPGVSDADRALAAAVLAAVGAVVWVDDDAQLDAVTALSGSGPAYLFRFLEGLIAGGQAVGLSIEQARHLALVTLAGATQLAAQSDDPPAVLRERVTSKGGTTAAALAVFDAEDFTGTTQRAIAAAANRARELGEELDV